MEANWDFFHINSVDLDDDGNLLISSRSMQTVYKIDRSGKILWRLGGKSNDFDIGPGADFAWQHDARRQPDGTLTIFDNGATPAVEKLSRGLILELDEQAMTATLLRQYTHPKILSGSQGSVQLLANGNVFVGWGEAPHVSEFDCSGRMLFDAMLGAKYQSYRAFRLPWTGRPAEAPAIAVSRARPASDRLRELERSDRGRTAGNCSRAPIPAICDRWRARDRSGSRALCAPPRPVPCLAVQALDGSGTPLGRSAAVTVAA